jgi:RND family efflux transporter MFP subunit
LSGCGKRSANLAGDPGKELAAASVKTKTVELVKHTSVEEVPGTVRAQVRATISCKSSGRIEEMPIVLGQYLKRGDLVARLDAAELKARVEQTEAGLEQAERDFKRLSALFEQQVITKAEVEATESRLRVAKAAVAEARAQLANATVVAPFDGYVTRKFVEPGDLGQPGRPLVDLEDPTRLQLEVDAPETVAARIQNGAVLKVRLGDAVAADAVVREISPAADPQTRTFRVKLDLPEKASFMVGQFARLLVPMAEQDMLRVPLLSVVRRGQLEMVFVVEQGVAMMHLVKTGRALAQEVEILSGLDAGDVVVVEGAAGLVDGQKVSQP